MLERIIGVVCILVLAACGGDNESVAGLSDPAPGDASPASIEVHSGDAQTARYGSPVSNPPAVRVLDEAGNPVAGVEVTFEVTEGGGSVSGSTQTTSNNGVASVGEWILGPTVGSNQLSASAQGLSGETALITATARNPYWTVMVYLAADNNLAVQGIQDIDEMESAVASPEVQVVVQAEFSPDQLARYGCSAACFNRPDFDTFRYVVDHTAPETNGPNGSTTGIGNRDMTDPAELSQFINWSKENHPAENYAVVLWNHGGGYSGLIEDVTSAGSNLMTLDEARQGLQNGGPIDLVDLDMCLMGGYETLAKLEGVTDYAVFSEENVPGAGNPYGQILGTLANQPNSSPQEVASLFVNEFHNDYVGNRMSTTKSAYDLGAFASFESELDELARALSSNLSALSSDLSGAASTSQHYTRPQLKDLVNFLDSLQTQTADQTISGQIDDVREAATGGFRVVNRARNGSGTSVGGGSPEVDRSTGLNILMPSGNGFDRLPDRGPSSFAAYQDQMAGKEWTEFLADWLATQNELLYTDQGSSRFEGYLIWEQAAVDAGVDIDFWILEPNGNLYIPWLGSVTPNGHLTNDSYYEGINYEGILTNRYVRNGDYRIYAHLWQDPDDYRPYYDLAYRYGQSASWTWLYDPDIPQLSLDVSWEDDQNPTWSEVESGAYTDLQYVAVLTFGSSGSASLRGSSEAGRTRLSRESSTQSKSPTPQQLETVRQELKRLERQAGEFEGHTLRTVPSIDALLERKKR